MFIDGLEEVNLDETVAELLKAAADIRQAEGIPPHPDDTPQPATRSGNYLRKMCD